MGREVLSDPEIADLERRASKAVGLDLRRLLCDAGEEELRATEHAQPALVFMGVALSRLAERQGIRAVAAAGHSVGEYAALIASGAASWEEGMAAVAERGRAMAAFARGDSGMLAVLGLAPEAVREVLSHLENVWPANFNTPTQTVVGGLTGALEPAAQALLQAGARRVLPLNVAAAFHTPLMAPAAESLRPRLEAVAWQDPAYPVVANVNARPHPRADAVASLLVRQLASPVLWGQSVSTLQALGCERFLELGPRRVLSGMMRELAPGAAAQAVSSPADLADLDSSWRAV